ncbi:MAG: hypothetical protein CTY16_08950 [Methylobacter sp.]|nr:MAG: hypothetical protein CTY16_08950 [Methylobacter sp.]
MTGFDLTILANTQSQARQKLETYINDNLANPTVGDVIGRRKAIIEDYPLLPAGLPNGDSLGKKSNSAHVVMLI